MMGWYGDGWWFAGGVGMLMMVVVWGALIGAAVWAVARVTRTDHASMPRQESARAILDRRFASGELSAEEYASARRTLE